MMVLLHRQFKKEFKKLSKRDKNLTLNCLELFTRNPFAYSLRNHALKGKYLGYRSIDIKPDLRALYHGDTKTLVTFVKIGTHNQLYR